MSVNVYDKETDQLSPLTSAFSTLAIVDVATVPTEDILDVIYRVSTDNWDFHSVALYSSDMATNKANLEAIGFVESTSGDDYIYTPDNKKIRYLINEDEYDINNVIIDSTNGRLKIYSTSMTLLADTTIVDGAFYPFWNASEWSSTNLTLSSSNMDANTTAFETIGFSVSTDNVTYTYKLGDKRVRYNTNVSTSDVEKIVVTAATGNMKMYGPSDNLIFDNTIVDGPYKFFYTDAVSYWIGNQSKQTVERLATYNGGGGGGGTSNVHSLQDIFNDQADQQVVGDTSLEFIDGDSSINISDGATRTAFENSSTAKEVNVDYDGFEMSTTPAGGSKAIDFKLTRSSVAMSNTLKNSFRVVLGINDTQAIIATVETGATASQSYSVGELVIHNNTLYKVTSAIAIGDSFTPGTNVTATTIEDLLNLRQNKILDAPMAIDSPTTNATTVEGALGLLNTKKINVSEKGANNGVATLNDTGKVPASQLPSYVDDVIEGYYNEDDGKFYETYTESFDAVTPVGTENPSEEGWYEFDGTDYVLTTDTTIDPSKTYYELVQTLEDEITGETGKIYVDLLTEKSYRWSGTVFVNIGSSLALGETSETAYRGDRGKIAYDDSQTNKSKIAKILGDIAAIEEETAITNHAIDEFILLDDQFYIVTAPITTGDTIAEGVNVEETTLNEALQKINTKQDYIFRGTHAEWEALTTEEKAKYDLVAFTDDLCADGDAYIAGSVVEGDMNAVSGGAVFNWAPFRFGIDEHGNYGYYKQGSDILIPFSARLVTIHAGVGEVVTIDDIYDITMGDDGTATTTISIGMHSLTGSLSGKTFTVEVYGNTDDIYCMPNNGEGILYWFGNEVTPLMLTKDTYGGNLTRKTDHMEISKYASSSNNNTFLTPTTKTNLDNYSKIHMIVNYSDTASYYQHLGYGTLSLADPWNNSTSITPTTTRQEASYTFASGIGEQYCGYETNCHPNTTYIYALWLDPR